MPGCDNALIRVEKASLRFGAIEAVREATFSVPAGSMFGLVGSDGAGKTSLLRMIATMIEPSAGSITIDGLDVFNRKKQIRNLIGYMPQQFGLYTDLTVEENLQFFIDVYGIKGKEGKKRKERYLGFSRLLPFTGRPAGKLSGGMKQKLGLACVLVHEPKVLILDEPTNGVDPVSRREFWDMLKIMQQEGMTILTSTAYLDEGEKCDQVAIMHRAQILEIATPAQLRSLFSSLEEAVIARIQEVDKELQDESFKR
ncbi:MAG: putative ABC transporter ATP-binding protein YbhF [Syntrophus sp. PtaB.Bin001]|nr:MAG: putative ABC transporter ATP-binding protein YbhF [Syntrophus sp. PtaB.Bin001]